jgi:SAM-dependent methyltransferase
MQNAFPPYEMTPYDPDSLLSRGQTRAHELLRLGAGAEARSFLELGCFDGMVLCGLHGLGKTVVGIDSRPEGFDPRAREAGVTFHVMDAAQLEFDDASFDFVYSYDCFEHFADPGKVLSEAARVTKPGGTIYIVFHCLYMTSWGAHLAKQIRVPYCHLLFAQDTLARYASTHLGETLDFDAVNRLGVREHRAILRSQETCLEVLSYREGRNTRFLGLVRQFPSLFRDRTNCFEDLIVEAIEVTYRRR